MSDKTLRELVYGKGAHVDPVACVEDISVDVAGRTVADSPHSIWQLVMHMNYWMDYELRKIAGETPHYPGKAVDSWPNHPESANEDQWQLSRQHFIECLARIAVLADSDPAILEKIVEDVGPANVSRQSTVRTTLFQITAHNSYHAGQIALLRRQAGAWPPERGGDTW